MGGPAPWEWKDALTKEVRKRTRSRVVGTESSITASALYPTRTNRVINWSRWLAMRLDSSDHDTTG